MLGKRFGLVIATAALAGATVIGLSGCGTGGSLAAGTGSGDASTLAADQGDTVTLSPEQTALTALGFSDTDVTTADAGITDAATTAPDVTATASPTRAAHPRRPRLVRLAIRRAALRGHVEHGEVTVETKKGDKTIAVQRGTITALSGSTMTVKSSDGFTMTWTITGPMTVIARGTQIQPDQIKTGDEIGVAGTASSTTAATARLVVVPKQSS